MTNPLFPYRLMDQQTAYPVNFHERLVAQKNPCDFQGPKIGQN